MGFKARGLAKGFVAEGQLRQPPRGETTTVTTPVSTATPRGGRKFSEADIRGSSVPAISGSREVAEKSESEPQITEGYRRIVDNADLVSKTIADRIQREGKVVFQCPFCRKEHEQKKECSSHITKEHKMAREAKKLEGAPKEQYTPRSKIIPPLINPADTVAPEYRRFYEGMDAYRKSDEGKALRSRAVDIKHGRAGNSFNAAQFMLQSEQTAISKLPTLPVDALHEVVRVASNKGKRNLVRAAKRRIEQLTIKTT